MHLPSYPLGRDSEEEIHAVHCHSDMLMAASSHSTEYTGRCGPAYSGDGGYSCAAPAYISG